MPLRKILDRTERSLLDQERELFTRLTSTLSRAEISPEDLETLQRSVMQLDELFLLVIVGEFNAGKSAFINALLGQKLLQEGVTPTTQQIHMLRYGEEIRQEIRDGSVVTVSLPVPLLEEINIVDTPGTNAVVREHEALTEQFVPRSDLVLFVTSADRPFTESERAFLERIREWGKKVLMVINKVDILEGDGVAEVEQYVRDNSEKLLGFSPQIFPVSAKLAMQAKTTTDRETAAVLWQTSRFEPLEKYVLETLDEKSRVYLKLLSPLGVAERLIKKYREIVDERMGTLSGDFSTIQNIDAQLNVYREDMLRDYGYRVSDIENHLLTMESRGMNFFDDTIRMARVFDLLNSERIRGSFEREVVADTPRLIEQDVNDTIDWFVDQDLRQWQAIMDYLNRRRLPERQDHVIGQVGSPFEYNRRTLLDSVGRAAQEAVATYDKEAEAKAIGEATQMAVAQAALLEVGAVGLGTLVAIALTSTLADFTGLMAASVLAVLGLFVIPTKRRQAKAELQAKVTEVRGRLVQGLRGQFQHELDRSIHRIQEAIAPYTRFVRAEGERIRQVQGELETLHNSLHALRGRIEQEQP